MCVTAIFGGTFNPPHIGHARMLEALQEQDGVERIWMMPDRIPPHKRCDVMAGDADRIAMCRLALAGIPKAELCLTEFEREGKSYSYDTLKLLKQREPQTEFAFVCGGDMLTSFTRWYRYRELMELVSFLVFRRQGTSPAAFERAADRLRAEGMRLTVLDREIPGVSSSAIRQNPEQAKALLQPAVYRYIMDRGIYHAGKSN